MAKDFKSLHDELKESLREITPQELLARLDEAAPF